MGLPGSGKTYHSHKECDVVVDDIKDLNQLPLPETVHNKTLGIIDVNFCDEKILSKALKILKTVYHHFDISIVYFENNSDVCRKNVLYRDDQRNVEGTICRFEKIYEPPHTARKIKDMNNTI